MTYSNCGLDIFISEEKCPEGGSESGHASDPELQTRETSRVQSSCNGEDPIMGGDAGSGWGDTPQNGSEFWSDVEPPL